jgi:hypothetical protein
LALDGLGKSMNDQFFQYLSKPVIDLLRKAGWDVKRVAQVDNSIALFEKYGWKSFETARIFLQSFNGLIFDESVQFADVKKISDYICFDLDFYEPEDLDTVKSWATRKGVRIFPIGSHPHCELYIGINGEIYESDGEQKIWKRGHSLNESLESLFFRPHYLEIVNLNE